MTTANRVTSVNIGDVLITVCTFGKDNVGWSVQYGEDFVVAPTKVFEDTAAAEKYHTAIVEKLRTITHSSRVGSKMFWSKINEVYNELLQM